MTNSAVNSNGASLNLYTRI